jgi:hypothetical protein
MLLGGSCPPTDFVQEHAKTVCVEFLRRSLGLCRRDPLANLLLSVMAARVIVLKRVPLFGA